MNISVSLHQSFNKNVLDCFEMFLFSSFLCLALTNRQTVLEQTNTVCVVVITAIERTGVDVDDIFLLAQHVLTSQGKKCHPLIEHRIGAGAAGIVVIINARLAIASKTFVNVYTLMQRSLAEIVPTADRPV